MRYISLFLFGVLALSSCTNFGTENSRKSTRFVFKDGTARTGELVDVRHDSLFIIGSEVYTTSQSEAKTPTPIAFHYSLLQKVILLNDASDWLNGIGGWYAGTAIGGFIGRGWYDVTNGYHALPVAPSYAFADIGRGFSVLIGGVSGGILGVIYGLWLASDKEIEIRVATDLRDLEEYARANAKSTEPKYRDYDLR